MERPAAGAPVTVPVESPQRADGPGDATGSSAADLALTIVFGLFVWAEVCFLTVVAFGLTSGLSKSTDWPIYVVVWGVGLPAAIGAVVAPAAAMVARFVPRPRGMARRAIDAIVLLGIFLATVALVFDPRLPVEVLHQTYYLGPVNAVLAGKSLLVDVNSYYGVLMIYALAATLPPVASPITVAGFTLLNTILICLQMVVVAVLMRTLTGSTLLTAGVMIVAVSVALTEAFSNPLWHAQNGPLRFGLPFVMLVLVALDDHGRRVLSAAKLGLLGVSALWSIEAFAYVSACYGAALLYDAWTGFPTFRRRVRSFARGMLALLAAVLVAHVLFSVATWLRSGYWPDWRLYGDFILMNAPGSDLGSTRMRPWDPWPFVILMLAGSTLAVAAHQLFWPGARADRRERLAFALAAFGILQFTYYLYRPVPASLLGCAVVAVVLASYWLVRVWQAPLPISFRLAMTAGAGMLLVGAGVAYPTTLVSRYEDIFVPRTWPLVSGALSGRPAAVTPFLERVRGEPSSPHIVETLALIQRYPRPAPRVAVFLLTGSIAHEVMAAGRLGHVFPVSQTAEDALTVSASERALAFEHGLGAGDVIFVDPLAVNALDRQIVRRLCREHDFEPLERTSAGVTALRLHPPGSPAGVAWCAAHFTPFIQGPDGTTYVVDLGTRRRLPDPETLRRYAGVRPSVADVRVLNDRDLARIPEGPPLDSALSGPIFAHDLMYAYQVTDDGQLLRLPNAATAAARGLKADASNMIVVLDDLFRFTPMPILRHYGVVIGDARTAPLVKGYQVEPGSSRLADLVVTPFVGIAPREGP